MESNSEYIKILLDYLKYQNSLVFFNNDTIDIFNNNKDTIGEICGRVIFDTLDGMFQTIDKNEIRVILVNSLTQEPTSLFIGDIVENEDKSFLESTYTCSRNIEKGGVLLRFLSFLIVNERNNSVNLMIGSASGGIPPLNDDDTDEESSEKKKKLIDYHINLGATVDGDIFTYKIDVVKQQILLLFKLSGGRKSKKKHKNLQYSKKKIEMFPKFIS